MLFSSLTRYVKPKSSLFTLIPVLPLPSNLLGMSTAQQGRERDTSVEARQRQSTQYGKSSRGCVEPAEVAALPEASSYACSMLIASQQRPSRLASTMHERLTGVLEETVLHVVCTACQAKRHHIGASSVKLRAITECTCVSQHTFCSHCTAAVMAADRHGRRQLVLVIQHNL